METARWQLDGNVARTSEGDWRLAVDLLDPASGVHLRPAKDRELGDGFLGVVLPGFTPGDRDALADVWVRGTDLVATYRPTNERPVRTQVYWRCHAATPGDRPQRVLELPVVVLDLIVAVQTDLLDAASRLQARSRLCRGTILWLGFAGDPESDVGDAAVPRRGVAAVVRPPRRDVSWVEAIHPDDFSNDRLTEEEGRRILSHQLFGGALEKGVILQARLRGALLPRESDTPMAARLLESFRLQPPALST